MRQGRERSELGGRRRGKMIRRDLVALRGTGEGRGYACIGPLLAKDGGDQACGFVFLHSSLHRKLSEVLEKFAQAVEAEPSCSVTPLSRP